MNASTRFSTDLRYRDGLDLGHRYLTPEYVLAPVSADLNGIGLDPCTEMDNPTGAQTFYSPPADGLALPWSHVDSIFVNPPYGTAKEPWVRRCIESGTAGQRVALLIPAHTDTRIWQEAVATAHTVCFIRGRLKFGVLRNNRRQEAASHPSCLIGWGTDLSHSASLGFTIPIGQLVAELRAET